MFIAAETLNDQLNGFSDVVEVRLLLDIESGYEMTLTLSNQLNEQIQLVCEQVSQLRLDAFGGGLSQFFLRARDIRNRQLDRANLLFVNAEREDMSFI
jgi:hypothetical protein